MAEFRVLVDWDDDAFFNPGVPVGTPVNEVEGSPYYHTMTTKVFNSSNVEQTGRIAETLLGTGSYGHKEITATLNATSERAQFGLTPPRFVRETWMKPNVLRNDQYFQPVYRTILDIAGLATGGAQYEQYPANLAFADTVQVFKFYTGRNLGGLMPIHLSADLTGAPVFSFYARTLCPENQTFKVHFYIDVAGVPTSQGSVTITNPTDTWTRYNFTFGANTSNSSKYTEYIIVERTAGTTITATLELAGFMLSDTPLSDINVDLRYSTKDSAFKLAKDINYKLSVWVKGSGTPDIKVRYLNSGATGEYLTSAVTPTLSSTYQRIDFDLSGRTDKANFDQIAALIATNMTGTITMTGWMLVQGTTTVPYHAGGATNVFDDITSYVLDGKWKTGSKNFDDFLSYEGEFDFTLDNASRIFSPANSSSPLFGNLRQNLRVLLQVKNAGVWTNLWSGWLDTWELDAGTGSSMRATMHCKQGIFRLREGEFAGKKYQSDTYSQVPITDIVLSTYRPVLSPFYAKVGQKVGIATVMGEDNVFTELQPGIYPLSFIGDGWSRKTKAEEALKTILTAEQSHLWIDRNGGVVVKNRHNFINRVADYVFSADTQAVEATYEYGSNLVNRVEMFLNPKKVNTYQIVWESRAAIAIGANAEHTTRLQFEFEEGKPRTITKLYTSQSDMNISGTALPVNRATSPSLSLTAAELNRVAINIIDDGGNNKTLTIKNNNAFPVYINVDIRGDFVEGGVGESYLFENTEDIALANAVHKEEAEVSYFENAAQARGYADFLFTQHGVPRGEFKRIRITDLDPTLFLQLQIGTILSISEAHTNETALMHVIIGENGTVSSGGLISIEYELASLLPQHWVVVGDSLPLVTNLIDGVTPATIGDAEVVSNIDLETAHGDSAYILPASEAAREFDLGLVVKKYPDLAPTCEAISDQPSGGFATGWIEQHRQLQLARQSENTQRRIVLTDDVLKVVAKRIGAPQGAGILLNVFLFPGHPGDNVGGSPTTHMGRLVYPDAPWTLAQAVAVGGGRVNLFGTLPGADATASTEGLNMVKSHNFPVGSQGQQAFHLQRVKGGTGGWYEMAYNSVPSFIQSGMAMFTPADSYVGGAINPGDTYSILYHIALIDDVYLERYIGSLRRFAYQNKITTLANANRRFVIWCKFAPGHGTNNVTLNIKDGAVTSLHSATHSVTENETIIAVDLNTALSNYLNVKLTVPANKTLYVMGYAFVDGNTTPANYQALYEPNNLRVYI